MCVAEGRLSLRHGSCAWRCPSRPPTHLLVGACACLQSGLWLTSNRCWTHHAPHPTTQHAQPRPPPPRPTPSSARPHLLSARPLRRLGHLAALQKAAPVRLHLDHGTQPPQLPLLQLAPRHVQHLALFNFQHLTVMVAAAEMMQLMMVVMWGCTMPLRPLLATAAIENKGRMGHSCTCVWRAIGQGETQRARAGSCRPWLADSGARRGCMGEQAWQSDRGAIVFSSALQF